MQLQEQILTEIRAHGVEDLQHFLAQSMRICFTFLDKYTVSEYLIWGMLVEGVARPSKAVMFGMG